MPKTATSSSSRPTVPCTTSCTPGAKPVARWKAIQVDLATPVGVDALLKAIADRPVDILVANAGHGLGQAFLDQDLGEVRHVVDTNISGTLRLLHGVGNAMRRAARGRILITGSIAGFVPGTYQAVYNGSKAFLDSFSLALRNELQDSGVSVTCLMPGPTDTEFFARAGLLDTKIGASARKMEAAEVAKIGYDAMMNGEGHVVAGLRNRVQAALVGVTPAAVLAEQHRRMAEPGSGP